MKKAFLFLLVFIITSIIPLLITAEDQSVLSTVYQQQRSDREDIIIFRNRDTLRGQVVNEGISIATKYGMLNIPVRACAGISFEGARKDSESVSTVNFNRFTGIITDRYIKFKIGSSGAETNINKEKIRFVLLKTGANESAYLGKNTQSDLFVMANDDIISGETVEKTLTVVTENARIPISFSDINTIRMQGNDNLTAVITKTNGEIVQGLLDADEISINLDLDIKIESVYINQVAMVFVDQAIKQAQAQYALAARARDEPDSLVFTEKGESEEQIINVNLEPLIGKRGTHMKLALIPAGSFVMGSGSSEKDRSDNEGPVREVFITKPFYMGIYEVTQEQYIAVMGSNPSRFNGQNNPVEQVSWDEAKAFCVRLSKVTGMEVTLPTEAEWEYAARAGSMSSFYFGDNGGELGEYAWYTLNSEEKPHPAGEKKPNSFGLYDMHGNVYEWCLDRYQGNYMDMTTEDPPGPGSGPFRVTRGGGWNSDEKICRSANRSYGTPDLRNSNLGFRVIIRPKEK